MMDFMKMKNFSDGFLSYRMCALRNMAAGIAIFVANGIYFPSYGEAMSPLPFFQRIERVGVLCAVDVIDGKASSVDLDEDVLCGRAVAVLSRKLLSGPTVIGFASNDARIADPGTLLLLVHATLRPDDGKRLLSLAATLQRSGSVGSAPFFMMPPQALALSGKLDESLLESTLRRLLTPLAKALRANP
ncbi:hypothetical protein [Azospirillum sp. TSA2s]|uniref:hypothetical protein n=1 Tax=Azospirillum sp. TSA2s TaxID=709810 RepID=UPI001B3BEA47|nr:hypothetical protein [Azospirillum sp. TSA2s]